jgi:hypothetical protein
MRHKRRIDIIAPTFVAAPQELQNIIRRMYDDEQHVYFIKTKNRVKIGVARDPRRRLKTLQVGSPDKLELAGVLPFGGVYFEELLHEHYKAFHIHGEWYQFAKPIREHVAWLNKEVKEQDVRWEKEPQKGSNLLNEILRLSQKAN